MLEIKILGAGCVDCDLMRDLVMTALDALVIRNVRIDIVMDPQQLGIWLEGDSPPGLVLNGSLVLAGYAPTLEEVITAIESAKRS